MPGRKVVILGGYGTFGRHVAEHLSAVPDVRLTIAGRHPDRGSQLAASLGAGLCRCDADDPASLRGAVEGAWLVINTSGPFRAGNYSAPLACIAAGCHYVDLADGRDY